MRAFRRYTDASLPLRLSVDHVAGKADCEEGRLVIDLTRSGVNSRAYKPALAIKYGDIKDDLPALHDYCSLALASISFWPDLNVVISKSDNKSWHLRVHVRPENVGQLAWVFYINNKPYLVLPTSNQFGSQ